MIEKDRRYLANKGKIIKDALADDKVNVIVVNGDTGMGKTTLLKYIRDTAVFPNIQTIEFDNIIRDKVSEYEIYQNNKKDTLFLLDEYPNTVITNLTTEIRKIRKYGNKIIIFSHRKASIMEDLDRLANMVIELRREGDFHIEANE